MSLLMAALWRKLGEDSWMLTLREDGSGVIRRPWTDKGYKLKHDLDWQIIYDFDCYSELENWLMNLED